MFHTTDSRAAGQDHSTVTTSKTPPSQTSRSPPQEPSILFLPARCTSPEAVDLADALPVDGRHLLLVLLDDPLQGCVEFLLLLLQEPLLLR